MKIEYSRGQLFALISLRIVIGWHFLYEGLTKLLNPYWTAEGYLFGSIGPFSFLFQWLGSSDFVTAIDVLNITALSLVGLSLILGIKSNMFSYVGIFLLTLYYLAYPPLPGWEMNGLAEGSYLIINKNLIEAIALLVLIKLPTSSYFGLESLFIKRINTSNS